MSSEANTKVRQPRKGEPVEPCGRCGRTGGTVKAGRTRPERISARAFGLRMVVCNGCYGELTRDRDATVPCQGCGTTAGHPRRPGGRPIRYSGQKFGRPGKWCHECVVSDPEAASAFFARTMAVRAADPGPAQIRRRAFMVLAANHSRAVLAAVHHEASLAVMRGDAMWLDDRPVAAADASRSAIRDFDATWIGGLLRP